MSKLRNNILTCAGCIALLVAALMLYRNGANLSQSRTRINNRLAEYTALQQIERDARRLMQLPEYLPSDNTAQPQSTLRAILQNHTAGSTFELREQEHRKLASIPAAELRIFECRIDACPPDALMDAVSKIEATTYMTVTDLRISTGDNIPPHLNALLTVQSIASNQSTHAIR